MFIILLAMTSVVNLTKENLWTKYNKLSDERTKGWGLVDTPTEVILLIFAYLAMVRLGPRLMEKRQPFKLQGLLVAYNFCLVYLNALIIKDYFLGTSRLNYNYLCHPSQNDYHSEEIRILNASWLFYVSKFLEFFDSLFFVLRKKNDQLSLLHVYHHSTMPWMCWIGIKWYPSGAGVRLPMLNSFIHVIMYSYYGISAFGPRVQKYLWWKKYLTSFQLIQFVISMAWSIHSLRTGCNHPAWIDVTNIIYMSSFLVLFGRFYYKKYNKKVK